MSGHVRQISEPELDGLLRAMLGAPDVEGRAAIERALRDVASTPQARPSILVRRPIGRAPALGWAATVAVAVALSVVITAGLLGLITPQPTPIPSPAQSALPSPPPSASVAPSASPAPAGFVLVGSPKDGYQLLVPASWSEVEDTFDDARTWQGPGGSVMVSYGSSIFDGGEITQCGPPTEEWPLCMTEEYWYSVPYEPESDGVAPLSIEGFVRDRCLGGCSVTESDTTLGGELAKQAETIAAGLAATYVSTFRNRRPVVVYWSAPDVANPELVEQMRASFAFVDAATPGEPPDPTELVVFTNPAGGYEILLPRFWGAGEANSKFPGMQQFYAEAWATTPGSVQLSISVGDADGTVAVCQNHRCETIVGTSLEELEAQLISVPTDMASAFKPEHTGTITLGGEPGRFMRPGFRRELGDGDWGLRGASTGRCLGCPGVRYFAFTIKDGRPVVISIDWWTIAFEEFQPQYLGEILASFRFTDERG